MTMTERLAIHSEMEQNNAKRREEYRDVIRHNFDATEREYILDHGWRIAADGLLELTAAQYRKAWGGRSLRHPELRTLQIPSIHGSCLIFEGKHFRIV